MILLLSVSTFNNNSLRNTIRVSNSLDLDQDLYSFGHDLGPIKLYYCHKVKHIPFDNTTKVLETVRAETFE